MSLSKKSKKIITYVLLALVLIGVGGYFYLYQSHKTLDDMEVVYKGSAEEFQSVMEAKAKTWEKEGDKVVELTGVITTKGEEAISVNENFSFQFPKDTNIENLAEGQKIKIKGRIIGYDDELLGELKLDMATIIKK